MARSSRLHKAISYVATAISYVATAALKVGQMTRTIWVTWVTFLESQMGLIYKLNYLDVIRISHVL